MVEAHREPAPPGARATARSSRSCRSARAGRGGSTTRTSTSTTTCARPRCPPPGTEEQLRALAAACSRSSSTATSRCGRSGWSRASRATASRVLAKTHHALVDGISGVDIATVLFDTARRAAARRPPAGERWCPQPLPTRAQLLGRGAASSGPPCRPRSRARSARVRSAAPRQVARGLRDAARRRRRDGLGRPAARPRPRPTTRQIGPHRRFTWVRVALDDVKAIKNALGGTVNDVVLAIVAGGARPPPAPPRREDRRARAARDGAGERARGRRSAARSATRWRRSWRRCRSGAERPARRARVGAGARWPGSRSAARRSARRP